VVECVRVLGVQLHHNRGITVARTRRRPYDPSKPHDRRATESNRGIENHLTPKEVDDPYEIGGKIIVMRSTRDDPLADLHARHMIDEAQYHAGREFQRHFEAVESGARAIDFTKEAVDGGRIYEGITDARMKSSDMLTIAYEKLGLNGQVIVHEVLVHNLTRKQMAESRGLTGKAWEEYYGKRFRECLDTLALVYGFAMEKR
jgi:hypothetical protein